MIDRKKEIYDILKQIVDPHHQKDIIHLKRVQELRVSDDSEVAFSLVFPSQSAPLKSQFKALSETAVLSLSWVKSVTVNIVDQVEKKSEDQRPKGLQNVDHIIAVSSCKGGVGKSTVAVNLAYALQQKGAKVGLFDADIYGPSLPTMVSPKDAIPQVDKQAIEPLLHHDVKLMSFGYLEEAAKGPAVMRGPMVSQVIQQLLGGTQWGDLDYLILDLPPGTGDIQITLGQLIPITAAIIVTTPQKISLIDVEKGIQMFDKLRIPTIGIVENMSYFSCSSCDEKHYLFGKGAKRSCLEQFGFKIAIDLPLDPHLGIACDSGEPYMISTNESVVKSQFLQLAENMMSEITRLSNLAVSQPDIKFMKTLIEVKGLQGEESYEISAQDLRGWCRCAHCINELTGEQRLDISTIKSDIEITHYRPVGNYAIAIEWSDHHSSLYPYEALFQRRAVITTT